MTQNTIAQERMKEFVRELVRELVDDEEGVRVDGRVSEQGLVLEVHVGSDADRGRVIGRGGSTARALRAMVTAAAGKHRLRCELVIHDHCNEERRGR